MITNKHLTLDEKRKIMEVLETVSQCCPIDLNIDCPSYSSCSKSCLACWMGTLEINIKEEIKKNENI